jgi:hypothetical protein
MGGVDAGLRNVACHVPDGRRIFMPSRFGYLRSTLPPHATPRCRPTPAPRYSIPSVSTTSRSSRRPPGLRPRCSSRSATPSVSAR